MKAVHLAIALTSFSLMGFLSCDRNDPEGNPSVSYHVAENINRMTGMNRVETWTEGVKAFDGAEIKAYAGVDPASGKTTVMLYHFKNALACNAMATVKLSVNTGLKNGTVSCQIRKVDDNCNWFDEWVADRKEIGITDDMFSWSPDDACGITKFLTSSYARGEYQKLMAKYRVTQSGLLISNRLRNNHQAFPTLSSRFSSCRGTRGRASRVRTCRWQG